MGWKMHAKEILVFYFTAGLSIGFLITFLLSTDTINPTRSETFESSVQKLSIVKSPSPEMTKTTKINIFATSETYGKPTIKEFSVKPDCQPTSDLFARLMDAIQSERKSTLLNACAKWNPGFSGLTQEPKLDTLYSSKYKYAVCEIFKCGYSSWLKAVLVMEGHYSMDQYLRNEVRGDQAMQVGRKQASFGFNKQMQTAKTLWNEETTSIVTVREPFSRLVSAYHNKMKVGSPGFSYIYEPISRRINKDFRHMRHNPEERNVIGNGTATFEDFLNFLLVSKKKDPHWNYFDSKCQPCHFKFDYIMKFDTLNDDVQYLKQRLNISDFDSQALFPKGQYKTDDAKVEKYFKDIPKELALKVFEDYRKDYELFGFSKPSWL